MYLIIIINDAFDFKFIFNIMIVAFSNIIKKYNTLAAVLKLNTVMTLQGNPKIK